MLLPIVELDMTQKNKVYQLQQATFSGEDNVYTIQLTPDLPVVRTGIKTLTVGANITPTFTATVKAMD